MSSHSFKNKVTTNYSLKNHTHTHTYIYIYIYTYIQASFVKDDGTLFIILNFTFSRLLVIFLVSGSRW